MVTLIKTARAFANYSSSLPSSFYTDAEKAIFAISSLTGWWETDYGLDRTSGIRWFDKLSRAYMTVLNLIQPGIQTATHGLPAIYTGYGIDEGGGSLGEFGELKIRDLFPMFSTAALTAVMVARVPTNDGGETALGNPGGAAWASVGPNTTATPKYTISTVNGHPTWACGGVQITNPSPTIDCRDGTWHIHLQEYNGSANTIGLTVDRGRSIGSASSANTDLDPTYAGMLSPVLGLDVDNNGSGLAPFYGQFSAFLTFNAVLTTDQKAAVYTYLAAKYGITLV